MIKGSRDYDSIGVPIPNSKIKIMDQQTDEPLGPHENGQICVWKSQSRSQESTSNQWIQTGHFGHYDSEGFFYYNSNNDLLIQIQNQLAQYLLVQQAVVIALNDDQNLIGFVSLNSNENVNLNELKEINFQQMKGKAQIVTNGDEYLDGDEYSCDNGFFQIEFVVSDININSSNQNSILTSCRNCIKLHQDNEFADVTLNVNGRELKAHKCMLAIRSPVFHRMFSTDMLESKTNIVNIDDISQDVFVQLLKYIYTGTADVSKYATELFLAAEKYLIDDLKEECKEIINNHISIDNCIKILVLADQVKDSLIQTKAIEFINRNKDKIDVDDLFEQHPHLIFKLYKAINLNTSEIS